MFSTCWTVKPSYVVGFLVERGPAITTMTRIRRASARADLEAAAAQLIQRAWLKANSDPRCEVCRRRLGRELTELVGL